MGIVRSALLLAAETPWIRARVSQAAFVKRAVKRFMPGETLDEALAAAAALRERGIGVVLTRLGENVGSLEAADETTRHYVGAWDAIRRADVDGEISVKLTQLGLDIDEGRCAEDLLAIAQAAARHQRFLWIDMEQHPYVDRTLDLYRRTVRQYPNVGVCLQAYLRRTAADLASLIPLGGGIRLVKGAYRESADVAFPGKSDVDENFFTLATELLGPGARASGLRAVFGTHDRGLIDRIQAHAAASGVAPEFHLLFGIQRAEQQRLVTAGARVRVLISYGTDWFPWYMRRLAERPANLWFVAKAVVGR